MLLRPCGGDGGMRLVRFGTGGDGWGFSPQTLAKEPSALWTLIRGDHHWSEARRAEGAPRLRGSRRTTGAPRRGTCGAPPIRHGSCRDTFPSGEGGWVACARAGLPYGRPASPGVTRSVMGVRGGDLLRRPTEAAQAPPAVGWGWRYAACPFRKGWGRWGFSPQTLARGPHGPLDSRSGGSGWVGGTARGGRAVLAGVTPRKGRGATRSCEAPPIRHGTAVTPSPPGKDSLVG